MKLRLGVMGPGRIFSRVAVDLPHCEEVELYAIASRNIQSAKEAAQKYGAARWYGSYEELLADPDVDLVYIATPHTFHLPHTLMCLNAGKHVICEKPLAVNDLQGAEMVRTARQKGLFLMEAMWTRFLPTMRQLCAMVEAGDLGEIRHMSADFAFRATPDQRDRIHDPQLAGGSLLDVGIYPLSVFSMLKGTDAQVQSHMIKSATGVDERTIAWLIYPDGCTAQMMSAIDLDGPSRFCVCGSKGRVEAPKFWGGTRLELHIGGKDSSLSFPPEAEGHYHQFDYAARCIRRGQVECSLMPHEESLKLLKLMTDMRRTHGILYPCEK